MADHADMDYGIAKDKKAFGGIEWTRRCTERANASGRMSDLDI